MLSRKEIDRELTDFDQFMDSKKSSESKLLRVIEQCILFNIQDSIWNLYLKLTDDPVYRGSGTFENFTTNLSNIEKYKIIKLIEELCKNDEEFNKNYKKSSHKNILWHENCNFNLKIQKELGILN